MSINTPEKILNKPRAAGQPFPDAPPRPKTYQPVTSIDDTSPDGLLARFTAEIERLTGEVFVVDGDDAARDKILDLLSNFHHAKHVLAWDFTHIPVAGLREAVEAAGIRITVPQMHDEYRAEMIESIHDAEVGLTGVDAAAATTGTLIVSTAPGKGRIPTILPPVHIAVITLDQIVPRLEDWVAAERADGLTKMRGSANVAFITGPSRTGDIEMSLILGVHGPGIVQVIVKR
jgi:L-lactate dehydrogenase complex protein LldG